MIPPEISFNVDYQISFHDAICEGDAVTVKDFLDRADEIGLEPVYDRSFFFRLAVENGHSEIVQLLLQYVPSTKDDLDFINPTALMNLALRTAVKQGSLEIVKMLLDYVHMYGHKSLQSPYVDPIVNDGELLNEAARLGDLEMIKILLTHVRIPTGSTIPWPDLTLLIALQHAIKHQNIKVACFFISKRLFNEQVTSEMFTMALEKRRIQYIISYLQVEPFLSEKWLQSLNLWLAERKVRPESASLKTLGHILTQYYADIYLDTNYSQAKDFKQLQREFSSASIGLSEQFAQSGCVAFDRIVEALYQPGDALSKAASERFKIDKSKL